MNTDFILWIDLETTGSADDSEIIEVGAVLTDTKDFEITAEFSRLVQCSAEGLKQIYDNPKVTQMHTENGLLKELREGGHSSISEADKELSAWLDANWGKSTSHIPLGGSGVSHFDRKFIARYMPLMHKRMTYWAYDVGVLRRTFLLLSMPTWAGTEDKTHRALDDIKFHVEEYRWYCNYLREGSRITS